MKQVIITDSKIKLRAVLNDTLAARDFQKRLPFTCYGYDTGMDYCCNVASGLYDPLETQSGWKNGDLGLNRGNLTLFYSGEESSEKYRDLMIIGYVQGEDLPLIQEMPERVKFTISES